MSKTEKTNTITYIFIYIQKKPDYSEYLLRTKTNHLHRTMHPNTKTGTSPRRIPFITITNGNSKQK